MSEAIEITEKRARIGKYMGDGTTDRLILLNFRPKRVEILSGDGDRTWVSDGDQRCRLHFNNYAGAIKFGLHDTAIIITDTGFTVRSDYTNKAGVRYEYEAVM